MDSGFQFRFQDRLHSLAELHEHPDFKGNDSVVLVAGVDLPGGGNVVHVHESEAAFQKWAQKTRYGAEVTSSIQAIRRARSERKEDDPAFRQRLEEEDRRVRQGIQDLARKTGLPWPSADLMVRAHGNIVDSVFLWDQANYQGEWRIFNIPGLPDFGWVGWNDRTSSASGLGIGALYTDPWYGGRALWLLGIFFLSNLAEIGFDNSLSSCWVTGP